MAQKMELYGTEPVSKRISMMANQPVATTAAADEFAKRRRLQDRISQETKDDDDDCDIWDNVPI